MVDLQESEDFSALGVELLSISPDPLDSWNDEARKNGITLPLLTDPGNKVAHSYGVMRWAMGSEPGHTFVLIDKAGDVAWLRDYGAPANGGLMYVEAADLLAELKKKLA